MNSVHIWHRDFSFAKFDRFQESLLTLSFKVIESAFFVNETAIFEESKQTYLQLTSNLDDTVRKHFTEWQLLAEKEIGKGSKNDAHKRLETSLMIRSQDKHQMIEVNFDR